MMYLRECWRIEDMTGRKQSVDINVADKKTLGMIKQVFRQLCFLNGI